MYKVKIYGAGSIGNHLAYACRSKGWEVFICDVDEKALQRTKKEIYPSRYGKWDDKIQLALVSELKPEKFDVVIIGTPPDSHIKLVLDILKEEPPKVLLIEKPLCTPSLEGCNELWSLAKSCGTFVMVGYNHTLTQNTQKADVLLQERFLGNPITISAMFREHWGGIFKAHPWLSGPQDSYLGFLERGGGACAEHSHAINIWQHFAHCLGMGRIVEVSAMLDVVKDKQLHYDRLCLLNVRTEKNMIGDIVQDVVTEPSRKSLRIQGSDGFLEWHVNWDKQHDALRYQGSKHRLQDVLIPKSRPDDFRAEINHIEDVLVGKTKQSAISLEKGLETMLVIVAAHISHQSGRTVKINYESGYSLKAIETT